MILIFAFVYKGFDPLMKKLESICKHTDGVLVIYLFPKNQNELNLTLHNVLDICIKFCLYTLWM